ncbi:MAG TPA: SDR family NAD(P)-dependent oxidoreductase [Solirubrobacteraceae bacterium]|nr:SDR family NAD(P)-dependent oxidoreductase [Solirubrobacteraceae bacterium]
MPVAVISGASTGIGRATALALAKGGWTVLAGVRNAEAGEQLRASAPDGRVRPITLDVTSPADVAAAAEQVRAANGGDGGHGRLDALVNNAGIGVGGPVEIVEDEDLRRQFDVNVFGQIALTRALLPALRQARGRIVFISSIGGKVATPFTAPYGASKHAIEAFGDAMRVELFTSGVQVTLVEPGSVATPIWDKGREEADRLTLPDELAPIYGEAIPKLEKVLEDTGKRGVAPEAVASTIERALGARRMRARYLVGNDARAMLAMKRLLPDHVFDRLLRRAMGL